MDGLLIHVGPLGVAVIFFAVVSAYTDANVACADANVVPDAFVDGGYANVDDALNW